MPFKDPTPSLIALFASLSTVKFVLSSRRVVLHALNMFIELICVGRSYFAPKLPFCQWIYLRNIYCFITNGTQYNHVASSVERSLIWKLQLSFILSRQMTTVMQIFGPRFFPSEGCSHRSQSPAMLLNCGFHK